MSNERHWDPQPGDDEKIAEHLARQQGVRDGFVQLDDGRFVRVGEDAEGEDE